VAHIETDYLIIGSGAVGLAFADTLLDETDAHITFDRNRWPLNDAIPSWPASPRLYAPTP
jgi:hypothetical protein